MFNIVKVMHKLKEARALEGREKEDEKGSKKYIDKRLLYV